MPSVVIINGRRIEVSGNNVSVVNDKVYVDGVMVADSLSGRVHIEWSGPLANLTSDSSVTINGSVQGSVDAGSYVQCGNVSGNVDAGSFVQCRDVGGSVDAGSFVQHK